MLSRTRIVATATLAIVALTAGTALQTGADKGNGARIIDADVLSPVVAPYTGATNAIRGVPGGGAPWVIAHGELEVRSNGRVKMEVEGLVVDPTFPNPAVAGINPSPVFKVIISCLSKDAAGAPTTVNVSTETAPADTAGNSELKTTVVLPSPCIAPIAFVTSGGGSWFAATGN